MQEAKRCTQDGTVSCEVSTERMHVRQLRDVKQFTHFAGNILVARDGNGVSVLRLGDVGDRQDEERCLENSHSQKFPPTAFGAVFYGRG